MFKIKITPGDRAFSLFIRYRDNWQCQRCLKCFPERSWGLDNSHFWSRGKLSTRHDEENCVALCKYCHRYFTANPAEHRDFFFKRLGEERFNALMVRANTPQRYRPDDRIVALGFRLRLKQMGVHSGRGPALVMEPRE